MALLCPPATAGWSPGIEEFLLANPLARIQSRISTLSRLRRELLVLAIAMAFGLLLLPWLIFLVGQLILGPYSAGGAGRFFADYFVGLAHGTLVFWIVACGPFFFVSAVRLLWSLRPARNGTEADAQRGQ